MLIKQKNPFELSQRFQAKTRESKVKTQPGNQDKLLILVSYGDPLSQSLSKSVFHMSQNKSYGNLGLFYQCQENIFSCYRQIHHTKLSTISLTNTHISLVPNTWILKSQGNAVSASSAGRDRLTYTHMSNNLLLTQKIKKVNNLILLRQSISTYAFEQDTLACKFSSFFN